MPEIITTPNALVQTTNGKRFYVNSGIVSVNNTETAIVDIDNIGERDIKLKINPIISGGGGDDMKLKLKNNSIIIYSAYYKDGTTEGVGTTPIHFIIPANTSLQITFQNVTDSDSQDVGVSCYGRYLSIE